MLFSSLFKGFTFASLILSPQNVPTLPDGCVIEIAEGVVTSNLREVVNMGGTGIVYFDPTFPNIAFKESYPSTKEKLAYECKILQTLQAVPNIERCLCTLPVLTSDRVVSLLSPFVNEKTEHTHRLNRENFCKLHQRCFYFGILSSQSSFCCGNNLAAFFCINLLIHTEDWNIERMNHCKRNN